jgi:hypothetical protein
MVNLEELRWLTHWAGMVPVRRALPSRALHQQATLGEKYDQGNATQLSNLAQDLNNNAMSEAIEPATGGIQ